MHSATVPLAAMAAFALVYRLAPAPAAVDAAGPVPVAEARPESPAAAAEVYYPGCDAVRAAGRAPLYSGQPGYRPEMDGDDDGIACEPHRGRGP